MRWLSCAVLVFSIASPAAAQRAQKRFAPADTTHSAHAWTPLRITKWGTLALSTTAAVYGFTQNRKADREYGDIERLCDATPDSCTRTSEGGAYSDAALEERYQSVVQRDSRAKSALLAGQIGIVASVVLFVLDLPKSATPQDIPYEPRPLRVGLLADGLAVQLTIATR